MQTETTNRVDIGNMIATGWDIFQQNMGGFIGYLILMYILLMAAALTGFGQFFVQYPLIMGFAVVAEKIHKGDDYSFGDFFGGFSSFVQLLVFNLLLVLGMLVIVLLLGGILVIPLGLDAFSSQEAFSQEAFNSAFRGLILNNTAFVIVPIIILYIILVYVMIRISFATYLIVLEKYNAMDAIKKSWEITDGQWWMIFLSFLISGFIGILGILALGIGLLFTIPAVFCMQYVIFRQLVPARDTLEDKINLIGNYSND